MIFSAIIVGIALGWIAANLDLRSMGVHPPLTVSARNLRAAAGRFITQASAALARAAAQSRYALARATHAARALLSSLGERMDRAQQYLMERAFERQYWVRSIFLTDPRDINSPLTPKGRKYLAHLAKHAHAFAPIQTTDPLQMAKAEGKRELFALILADIFNDLPNFARMMAAEEARLAEEIVAA